MQVQEAIIRALGTETLEAEKREVKKARRTRKYAPDVGPIETAVHWMEVISDLMLAKSHHAPRVLTDKTVADIKITELENLIQVRHMRELNVVHIPVFLPAGQDVSMGSRQKEWLKRLPELTGTNRQMVWRPDGRLRKTESEFRQAGRGEDGGRRQGVFDQNEPRWRSREDCVLLLMASVICSATDLEHLLNQTVTDRLASRGHPCSAAFCNLRLFVPVPAHICVCNTQGTVTFHRGVVKSDLKVLPQRTVVVWVPKR
jgi:hypothetical protein